VLHYKKQKNAKRQREKEMIIARISTLNLTQHIKPKISRHSHSPTFSLDRNRDSDRIRSNSKSSTSEDTGDTDITKKSSRITTTLDDDDYDLRTKAKRMWTRADKFHAHAVSGLAFSLVAVHVMCDWCVNDCDFLFRFDVHDMNDTLGDWKATGTVAIVLATACAITGLPLANNKGFRKIELSYRSLAFQIVMTWQLMRLVSAPESFLKPLDSLAMYGCLVPFVWHTMTYLYILFFTNDDKRSVFLVWFGVLLFGLQLFPTAYVLTEGNLAGLRSGLSTIWEHSIFGLIFLLNWSTFGASLKARRVIDDDDFRSWYLIRPSAFWMLMFALDSARYHPFTSVFDYVQSRAGSI
jgi:hypothetical protein